MEILIVDDEPKMQSLIAHALAKDGHRTESAGSLRRALELLDEIAFDAVITDLKMETDEAGLEILERVMKTAPDTAVILITGYATIETGARAIRSGAYDYLIKPVKIGDLRERVRQIERKRTVGEKKNSVEAPVRPLVFDDIVVGSNPKMQRVYEMLPRIVGTGSNLLIRGESGTGKEVIARAIHRASPRKGGPFVEVNCAALVDTLLESELFGIEKRVATGVDRREGKFEQASGGTLFLDEIGDMSLATQAKVLRAMQSHRIERVGGKEMVDVDVRILAATNVNLEEAVREGRFREDLFYRLNVITVEIPPLRERREDIPHFVEHFLRRFNAEFSKPIEGIDEEAMDALRSYSWPGNVRELENTIERAFLMSRDAMIRAEDLPEKIRGAAPSRESFAFRLPDEGIDLEQVEREFILQALEKTGGNRTRAAELLGLTRRILGYRLDKYRIRGDEDPKNRKG
ncbi:MAG: sigma-54-dependent Fis family transcriptional regulator [Candidatus Eisenbacteria bacterium]|nr:sigma-54-dependent Fis family transcriptional regulator [Candidatus Eisenbacteria bacterium]